MIADSIINNEPAKAKRQVETMLNRQSNFNLQSMLYRLVLLSSCLVSAMSMSYLGLDMRTPKKCVAVSYPGSNIDIIYEVFDPNKDRLTAGLRMPDSSIAASSVVLEVFPPDGSSIIRTKENHLDQALPDLSGRVKYSASGSGEIHVCVEVQELPERKYPRPTLVGIRITESIDVEETAKKNAEGQEVAKKHLSEMERILMNMIRETNLLLKNADSIKDVEVGFHQKSIDMNAASRWWPMIHVIVLLVTGFTQANHIIKFFKTQHII